LARWLLRCEADEGGPSDAETCEATRVCDKLRAPLTVFAGALGYRSLLARALTLAKAEEPLSVGAVEAQPDGSLKGLFPLPSQQAAGAGALRGEAVVTHLLGLLTSFIGPSLTLRIVRDIWPAASSGENQSDLEKLP
jgi:hypothetical protein